MVNKILVKPRLLIAVLLLSLSGPALAHHTSQCTGATFVRGWSDHGCQGCWDGMVRKERAYETKYKEYRCSNGGTYTTSSTYRAPCGTLLVV